MREHRFWDDYAEAMQLASAGNQQITREFGQYIANIWRAAARAIAQKLSGISEPRNLPPV